MKPILAVSAFGKREWLPAVKGSVVAAGTFLALGTLAALWSNPLFIRMTPSGAAEIALLVALSVLLGAYVAIRRPRCSAKSAGAGGVAGFLGIACPTCNKALMLLLGGEFLLTYFEPVRLYLAAAGVLALAAATWREWTLSRETDSRVGLPPVNGEPQ